MLGPASSRLISLAVTAGRSIIQIEVGVVSKQFEVVEVLFAAFSDGSRGSLINNSIWRTKWADEFGFTFHRKRLRYVFEKHRELK